MVGEPELVTVTPGLGGVPGVKVLRGQASCFHPNIPGQGSVHGSMKLLGLPSCREGHRNDLAGGVDSTVRSTGGHHGAPGSGEALQCSLHLALDRSAFGLELPPVEISPVVMDGQPESVFAIWVHADKVEGRGCTSRKGWTRPRSYAYR